MLKIILPISILLSFLVGVFFGTRAGFETQMYYDAPNKIKILSHQLDNDDPKTIPLGQIITQVRILNEPELTPFKSAFFLQVTGESALVSAHEKYISIIKDNTQYKEKMQFLCKHNESYSGKCN